MTRYRRPSLAPYQLDALFGPERYAIVEASTKVGKTVGAMVWLTEQALQGTRGRNYWWLAPIREQARMVLRRVKHGVPPSVYTASESTMSLRLVNGAVLRFKGADHPDGLFGEDVYAAVIDEATRVKEEAWHAIRSTLTATHGSIRIIGNVKGRRNWAYQLARKAQHGEPTMRYRKITCHDAVGAGILSKMEVEDARRQLPEAVFKELYLAEPSDDVGNPFGLAAIRACIAPLSRHEPAVWGWDVAKSVDWTVGIGIDAYGHVARVERFQRSWQETIATIRRTTASATALVDSTGVGDPVVEALQKESRPGTFEGFKFTAVSKQQLMEGLAVAIQQRQIRFPEGVIVQELETFEYDSTRTGVRYAAPAGLHDDAVCALALARRAMADSETHPSLVDGARFPLYY